MTEIAQDGKFDFEEEEQAFTTTFRLLKSSAGSDSFRKYDAERAKFMGGFLVSGFEVVALGLGYNYQRVTQANLDIKSIIEGIWQKEQFTSKSGSGIRASSLVPNTIPLGRKMFTP
jgi:hypothetical protein